MSRYPVRESRTSLSPDLIEQLGEEGDGSGVSDLSQSLSSQSDSNANDSDFSSSTVSRTNSTEYIPVLEKEEETEVRVANLDDPAVLEVTAEAGGAATGVHAADIHAVNGQAVAVAPGVLQAPVAQAGAMGDTVLPATYDDLTGVEIRLESQRILCFYCWDLRFYECDAHIKRTVNGGKPSLCGQDGEAGYILKIRDADDDVNGGRVPGKLKPKLRKKLDKDLRR